MKKLLAVLSMSALSSLVGFAQGTVLFQNVAVGLNAPVFLDYAQTIRLSGPDYTAVLLAGPTPLSLSEIATTPFLSGARAGYFLGGVVTIPSVAAGGTAYFIVEAWNSALFPTLISAQLSGLPNVWGSSSWNNIPMTVTTGNPLATPPGLPATLTGLNSFALNVPIPEPTTPAFGGLFIMFLILLRADRAKRWLLCGFLLAAPGCVKRTHGA